MPDFQLQIKTTGHVVIRTPGETTIYSPADTLPTEIQTLVNDHEHASRRNSTTAQAYLDRQAAEAAELELTPEQKEAEAVTEAKRAILDRMLDDELAVDSDMRDLIDEAKTKDKPGQWLRDNLP